MERIQAGWRTRKRAGRHSYLLLATASEPLLLLPRRNTGRPAGGGTVSRGEPQVGLEIGAGESSIHVTRRSSAKLGSPALVNRELLDSELRE